MLRHYLSGNFNFNFKAAVCGQYSVFQKVDETSHVGANRCQCRQAFHVFRGAENPMTFKRQRRRTQVPIKRRTDRNGGNEMRRRICDYVERFTA
jgi:hypothetical protein